MLSQVCATFLLPEMVERTASILNYFLSYLTGPQRRKLAIRDPEKYNFRPRYVCLALHYLHFLTFLRCG